MLLLGASATSATHLPAAVCDPGPPSLPVADCNHTRWDTRRAGPGDSLDIAMGVVVHPGGGFVYAAGFVGDPADFLVEARDAATGVLVWQRGHDGGAYDYAYDLAVSPGGDRVFVTGGSDRPSTERRDFATIAYDARTGERLWIAHYDGPAGDYDEAMRLAVSPDGARVFATGWSRGDTSLDLATVAYDAETGTQLWVQRHNGPGDSYDRPQVIRVSPTGDLVFVAGWISRTPQTSGADWDQVLVAYDAATGAQRWIATRNGPSPHPSADTLNDLAVSPDGARVYALGNLLVWPYSDISTAAYDAATGEEVWVRSFNLGAPGGRPMSGNALALDLEGRVVYVTGRGNPGEGDDAVTLAYEATTGGLLWKAQYNGPKGGPDEAFAMVPSPDGALVYVAARSMGLWSADYAVLGYDASTGEQAWLRRYDGTGHGSDLPRSLATEPGGGRLYVAGGSFGLRSNYDFSLVAYDTTAP